MFVFYILGTIFAAFSLFGSIWALFSTGRLSPFINFLLDVLAFLTIGIASAVSTAIIVKAVDAVNKYGGEIGVAAWKGGRFLGMTWAAVAVMLFACVVWIVECCKGRKRDRRGGKGEKSVTD